MIYKCYRVCVCVYTLGVYNHRTSIAIDCSGLLWFNSAFRIPTMIAGKRMADIGYKAFSGSMILLTVYGGYLCAMRGYRFMQRQKELKLAAENQDPEVLKDWPNGLLLHRWTFPIPAFVFIHHKDYFSSWDVIFHCSLFLTINRFIKASQRTLLAFMACVKFVLTV